MKKIGLLALVLSIIANTTNAQFYVRAGLGYALPQAGQTIDGTGTPYNGTQNSTAYSQAYSLKGASFSTGVQSAVGFGYLFNDHIGFQLDAGIGLANKKYTYNANNVTIAGSPYDVTVTQQANTPFILMPSLVLQTGGNAWNIYSRFGIALPLSCKMTEDEIYNNQPGASTLNPLTIDDFNFQIKNSFSLGFTAALGVQYKINDVFSVWGEVSLLSMSLYIKEADIKNWNENGQNVSLNYYGGPQVVKYSKSATVIDSIGATQPAYAQPFSNVGLNVGISIRLSEKHSRSHNDDIDDDKNFKRKRF